MVRILVLGFNSGVVGMKDKLYVYVVGMKDKLYSLHPTEAWRGLWTFTG